MTDEELRRDAFLSWRLAIDVLHALHLKTKYPEYRFFDAHGRPIR